MINNIAEIVKNAGKRALTGMIAVCTLVLMFSNSAEASHIVGGEITYECLGNNRYRIFLTVYRDCENANPSALFDNPAAIGFFDGAGQNLINDFTNQGVLYVKPNLDDTLTTRITSQCFVQGQEVCVHTTTYRQDVTLPFRPDGYVIAYQRCCRNSTINNILEPALTGATFSVRVTPEALQECNTSPKFKTWPPVYICANDDINFDHSAIGRSGDSLVYKLVTPSVGATFDDPKPNRPSAPLNEQVIWQAPYNLDNLLGGTDPLRIDPQTGRISGTPTTIGQFLVGIQVEQYRNGVLLSVSKRDFQYNVRLCGEQTKAEFEAPTALCDTRTVTFENLSDNALNYRWFFDFPNDDPNFVSTETNPTFTYPALGEYTVALVAWKDTICIDTAFQVIKVSETTISADFTTESIDCDSDLKFQLVDTSVDSVFTVNEWLWTIEIDGETIAQYTTQNPIHTINNFGKATITLTVTSTNGCSSTLSKEVDFVNINDFDLERNHDVCETHTLELNPDPVTAFTYRWSPSTYLSDSTAANPIATPLDTIYYSVEVTDTLTSCKIFIDSILVNVIPGPKVEPVEAYAFACVDTIILELVVEAGSDYSYHWEPAHKVIGEINTPTPTVEVVYGKDTLFTYTVTDTITGCDVTGEIVIQFEDLVFPEVSYDDSLVVDCSADLVLEVINEDPSMDLTWSWTATNGIIVENGDTSTPTVRPTQAPRADFMFVATNWMGCTAEGIISVYPDSSDLGLDFEFEANCASGQVHFFNTSEKGYEFTWDFGDDSPQVKGDTVSHTYGEGGDYTITLYSSSFCHGSVTKDISIILFDIDTIVNQFSCIDTLIGLNPDGNPNYNYTWNTVPPSNEVNPQVLVDSTTVFTAIVTHGDYPDCKAEIVSTVHILAPEIDIDITGDRFVCKELREVTLTAEIDDPQITVSWFDPENNLVNTGSVYTFTPTSTVTLRVEVVKGDCVQEVFVEVIVSFVDFENELTHVLCEGPEDVELNPQGDTYFEYEWNTVPPSNEVNPTVFVSENTNFVAILTDPNNRECVDTLYVEVVVSEEFNLSYTDDLEICGDGSDITLSASARDSVSFSWQDENGNVVGSGSSIIVNPTADQVFTVVAEDQHGCIETGTISISIRNLNISVQDPKFVYCTGDTLKLLLNADEENLISTITWSPELNVIEGQGTSNPTVVLSNNRNSEFFVTVVYSDGCIRTESIVVQVSIFEPAIFAEAYPDTILEGESSDLITVDNSNYTYLWSPRDFMEQGMETTFNPTVTPPVTTIFTVQVINQDGCTATASAQVNVIVPICEPPYIFIPTAFTPNGDGHNDVFYVRGHYIDELEILVFDRWGNEVFKSNDINIGWDGYIKGKLASPDVFGYIARIKCLGGEEVVLKGNVTILQ